MALDAVRARLSKAVAGVDAAATQPRIESGSQQTDSTPGQHHEEMARACHPDTVWTCAKKSQIRRDFALDSEKAGVLAVGDTITALGTRLNPDTVRLVCLLFASHVAYPTLL